jgi:hypothetical protein
MEANMTAGQVLKAACLTACMVIVSHNAQAFDFNGAWATNGSACGKIFDNKNGQVSLAKDADMYGAGFIARSDAIVGNNATCKIVSRKVDGPISHIVAQCAAENVAFSTFQFSYRIKDDNNIVRIYPGVEELNQNYSRCTF